MWYFILMILKQKKQQDEYIDVLKDCRFEGNIHRNFK